jgi:abortive infection bacteriophage resistance protein
MLSIDELIEYMKKTHHIDVNNTQKKDLRNLGYYHGFKGYRFIREDKNRIAFSSFDEVIALNNFDMQLKALLYPKVLFIETALKNYLIEALLDHSQSDVFNEIYNRSLTDYKSYTGKKNYKDHYSRRLKLKRKIYDALIRDYGKKSVVSHFFDTDRQIPIWAIFETLSLGEFGTLFSCSCTEVKVYVSSVLHLPTNRNSNGLIVQHFIFAIKDLRNALAHNNVIFDTRFKTSEISNMLKNYLQEEMGIREIDYKYIDSYIIMITYFLIHMGESKKSCYEFVDAYINLTEMLRKELPVDICNKILSTNHKNNMERTKKFIESE